VKTNDGRIGMWIGRKAPPRIRKIAEALRRAAEGRRKGRGSEKPTLGDRLQDALADFNERHIFPRLERVFPELEDVLLEDFLNESGLDRTPVLEWQELQFTRGYAELRSFRRGDPDLQRRGWSRPGLHELADCLPYFLPPSFAHALARVLLALNDPRTPKDVKHRLRVHLRDILRGDGLLYDARPLPLPSRPVRIVPEIKRAFPSLYESLLARCQETSTPTMEMVRAVIRERVPDWDGRIKTEKELQEVLPVPSEKMKPHKKGKAILMHVFGISAGYVRLLIYGW
jgi:hypothetical protein